MKKHLLIALLLAFSSASMAVDYQGLSDSVDKEKAAGFVDQDKMGEAVAESDYDKGYDSVDKQQASDSVDTDKALKALSQ